MKPIVIFQNGTTQSEPWDDIRNFAGTDLDFRGYFVTVKKIQAPVTLSLFDKPQPKIVFTEDNGNYIFTSSISEGNLNMPRLFSVPVNMDLIIKFLDSYPNRYVGFGSEMNRTMNAAQLLKDAFYFSRSEDLSKGAFVNIQTQEPLTVTEQGSIDLVPWFFAYKMGVAPIYFFAFNPNLVGFGHTIERESETVRYRVLERHNNKLPVQLLRPLHSKNVVILDDHWWVVKGNSFSFDVGKTGFIGFGYKDELDQSYYKIASDLVIEHIAGNKYKATFKEGQQSAYLSIRMQTNSLLSYTMTNSGNKLALNIQIQKHFGD